MIKILAILFCLLGICSELCADRLTKINLVIVSVGKTATEAHKSHDATEKKVLLMVANKWGVVKRDKVWLGDLHVSTSENKFVFKRKIQFEIRESMMGMFLDDCIENGANLLEGNQLE